MNKIYVFSNGMIPSTEDYHGIAVAEDGHVLAQCISSNISWIKIDLGATPEGRKNHDRYNSHYPNGFEVEWVEDPSQHAGMLEAQKLNQELARLAKIEEVANAESIIEQEMNNGND